LKGRHTLISRKWGECVCLSLKALLYNLRIIRSSTLIAKAPVAVAHLQKHVTNKNVTHPNPTQLPHGEAKLSFSPRSPQYLHGRCRPRGFIGLLAISSFSVTSRFGAVPITPSFRYLHVYHGRAYITELANSKNKIS